MSKVIDAIFENGVFKPLQHVEVKEHEKVAIKIISLNDWQDRFNRIIDKIQKKILAIYPERNRIQYFPRHKRRRIKDKYGITEDDIKELLVLIEERAELVSLAGNITICWDNDDNLVIETVIKGQASFLVTRDDDMKFDKEVSSFLLQYGVTVVSVT